MPSADNKTPLVLIIAGSGPTDRNGNTQGFTGRNDSLKMLADALADAGIASVRYDKRGVAQSAGAALTETELRVETYVQDAAAWIAVLSQDPRFSGVSVLGHSEGALIGLLAVRSSAATSFVSIAGPGDALPAILRRQLRGRLPAQLAQRNEEILQSLEAGSLVPDVPPELQALYRPSVQPYLISSFKYSPATQIARLQIPCLILHGDTDIQVSARDATILQAAQPKCQLKTVLGMNHVMKLAPADAAKQIASYGDPSLPVAQELVKSLVEFLSPK